MKFQLFLSLVLFTCSVAVAQHTVSGVVSDDKNEKLYGVNIVEKGTVNGTVTEADGAYTLRVSSPNATLVFSYTGYSSQEIALAGKSQLDVTLTVGINLGEIQVVGSRSYNRSATNTPVAVDVVDIAALANKNGQLEINQILQIAAPSFNATKQSGSDGADHIDPATLRGLGPDQTLVLINGKRRHQSSLVNIFGTRGRGNTGTDLNAIPASAIKRIEILRDGASAQYGSDAIAGVINIVLHDQVGELNGSITQGAYLVAAPDEFPQGTPNTKGYYLDTDGDGVATRKDDPAFDGLSTKVAANYGFALGGKGFANVTTEYITKDKTLRPGADFRRGYGEAAVDGFSVMLNAGLPLSDKTEFYVFGGRNHRNTDAYAFTRNPESARIVQEIYPNGFTPRITSVILDNSISAGLRTQTSSGWNVDFNNTYGKNDFHYYIKGTNNASLGASSPTEFDAGGHSLSQNTASLGFTRFFKNNGKGINLAFGMEHRIENFVIFAGETGSYATYDTSGLPVTFPDQVGAVDPVTGDPRPGGSQGFPGYSPANEVDQSRTNIGLYADAEFDLSKSFLLGVAGRFENYSDFGNTFNYKLAARYAVTSDFALRGAISSGFRAPSLVQRFYNLRFTNFIAGVAFESLLAPNNSPIANAFGIKKLKEEEATNASLGFTFKSGGFSATVDGYYITIDDRIVLTDIFDASPFNIGVSDAQFFVNGIDTKTTGVDIVLSWKTFFGENSFSASLAGNINDMEIASVNNGNLDRSTFFGPREEYFVRASAPPSKFGLNLGYSTPKLDVGLNLTRFSGLTILDFQIYEDDADYGGFDNKLEAAKDIYEARLTADLSLNYKFSDQVNLTIGGNNILNTYPTIQDDWSETGGYWDSVQMGFSGAYFFGRLGFRF